MIFRFHNTQLWCSWHALFNRAICRWSDEPDIRLQTENWLNRPDQKSKLETRHKRVGVSLIRVLDECQTFKKCCYGGAWIFVYHSPKIGSFPTANLQTGPFNIFQFARLMKLQCISCVVIRSGNVVRPLYGYYPNWFKQGYNQSNNDLRPSGKKIPSLTHMVRSLYNTTALSLIYTNNNNVCTCHWTQKYSAIINMGPQHGSLWSTRKFNTLRGCDVYIDHWLGYRWLRLCLGATSAFAWTNAHVLPGTRFNAIRIMSDKFFFRNIHLKIPSVQNIGYFVFSLNVLFRQ